MQIKNLADNKEYVEIVARWIYDEFIKEIRNGITYDMVVNRFNQRKRDAMPITIVAVKNGQCIGTASLVENDLKEKYDKPWLASLYVDNKNRKLGIGRILIKSIELIAKRLGYDALYLRTEHASEYYRRLSWKYTETMIDEFGLETNVFVKNLKYENSTLTFKS